MPRLLRRSSSVSVTVVIPVKDDAASLRRCLIALKNQRIVVADEVIVVDSGSSDDSVHVALSYGVRVLHESAPGIAAATGYDAADGDVIARLDADSIPPTDWIESIHRAFDSDPMLVGVTGSAVFHDGPRILRRAGASIYLASYYAVVGTFLSHIPLFGSNCAFRRADWLEVRGEVHPHDPLMHDDIDLSIHLGPERRIRFDAGVRMAISSRAVWSSPSSIAARWRRGIHSLFGHGADELPVSRYSRRWGSRTAVAPADLTVTGTPAARGGDLDPR